MKYFLEHISHKIYEIDAYYPEPLFSDGSSARISITILDLDAIFRLKPRYVWYFKIDEKYLPSTDFIGYWSE